MAAFIYLLCCSVGVPWNPCDKFYGTSSASTDVCNMPTAHQHRKVYKHKQRVFLRAAARSAFTLFIASYVSRRRFTLNVAQHTDLIIFVTDVNNPTIWSYLSISVTEGWRSIYREMSGWNSALSPIHPNPWQKTRDSNQQRCWNNASTRATLPLLSLCRAGSKQGVTRTMLSLGSRPFQ